MPPPKEERRPGGGGGFDPTVSSTRGFVLPYAQN